MVKVYKPTVGGCFDEITDKAEVIKSLNGFVTYEDHKKVVDELKMEIHHLRCRYDQDYD